MPLESHDLCPNCGDRVLLAKSSGGDFLCPTCSCVFRHNTKKWFIALPVVLLTALGALYLTWDVVPPIAIAFLSAGGVALVLSRIPNYSFVTPGTPPESRERRPNQS